MANISEKDEDDDIIERMESKAKVAKNKQNMIISVCMPKLKFTVLEAQDLEKELLRDIKERIGGQYSRRDQLIDLDIKFKGLPFLEFDVTQTNLRYYQSSQVDVAGLFVQDIALVNVEKRAEAKMILYSSQNDLY
jgi:hypothetical protein